MSLPVLISYSNYGYIAFAVNLLINLDKNAPNYTIHFYCLDQETKTTLESLQLQNLKVVLELVDANLSKNFESYGTTNYNNITKTKIDLLYISLLRYNFIHFIDCDVVCIRAPAEEYWKDYENYDIVFQYDAGFVDSKTPHGPIYHIWACTGNTTLRNTLGTMTVLSKIKEYSIHYNRNDQECLYQYFQDLSITDVRQYVDAKLTAYPYEEFTNGYYIAHDIGDTNRTYFFHANHVSGPQAKIELLKKVNCWYL